MTTEKALQIIPDKLEEAIQKMAPADNITLSVGTIFNEVFGDYCQIQLTVTANKESWLPEIPDPELRAKPEQAIPDTIEITPDLVYYTKNRRLLVNGTTVSLTTKEGNLFQLLALNLDGVVERKDALMKVWTDDNYFNARSMDVYITKLRKLIKPVPSVEIINHHGKGYSLQVNNHIEA